DIMKVAEDVYPALFKKFGKRVVTEGNFRRIPYKESMLKYGTDKPDLTNPLIIEDLTNFFSDVDFPIFKGKPVRGIVSPNTVKEARSFFETMLKFAQSVGMKGLGYIEVVDKTTWKGPIVKFLTDDKKQELQEMLKLKTGDVLFFICDDISMVNRLAGEIRTELGKRLNLIDNSKFEFCFVTQMPMYEISEITGKLDFMHNPFSMPQGGMDDLINKQPLDIYADQFDVVCNGVELVSGAVRNNRPEVLVKAFELAGYNEDDIKAKFNALYNAFRYGCPPHVGMALGIDRSIMMLLEEDNVREAVAFPLNQNGEDVLTGTPNEVSESQLREVHIKLR
ncbi:MAG: amino acid--tRNA ligase-related protein, partial [Bacilli bacterium]